MVEKLSGIAGQYEERAVKAIRRESGQVLDLDLIRLAWTLDPKCEISITVRFSDGTEWKEG